MTDLDRYNSLRDILGKFSNQLAKWYELQTKVRREIGPVATIGYEMDAYASWGVCLEEMMLWREKLNYELGKTLVGKQPYPRTHE